MKHKSLAEERPDLVEEWDFEKNGTLLPTEVSCYSRKKVWWKCKVCGHEWFAGVAHRYNGTGCPNCNKKKASIRLSTPGVGQSFKDRYPELLKEWDYEKNDKEGIYPDKIFPHTDVKVHWQCEKGHKWVRDISGRILRQSGCPVCQNRKVLVGYNDLATKYPDILKEWDYEKNDKLGIFPNAISCYSNKKVWWKCSKGHSWQTNIVNRTKGGTSCPYCLNKKVLTGYNDFATLKPHLLKEWDFKKNDELGIKPNEVGCGSEKKVWWKCSVCGDEWLTTIYNRSIGRGCPSCKIKKIAISNSTPKVRESFKDKYPELLKDWDYEENNKEGIYPDKIFPNTNVNVHWKCEKGHKWTTKLPARVNTHGSCPVCRHYQLLTGYNDLATMRPDLLREWDYEKNNKLGIFPDKVRFNSNKRVWWKCEKGHNWDSTIANRTREDCKCDCPICKNKRVLVGYNDLASQRPELVKEWDSEKNGTLTPKDVSYGSLKQVWWKCHICGHEWKTTVYSRSVCRSGCKKCKRNYCTSFPEQAIFYYFKKLLGKKIEVLNQFQFRDEAGSFEIDIFVPSIALAIEHDGEFWHKDKRELDLKKTERLEKLGIRLYRFKESDRNCVEEDAIYYDYHKNRFGNLVWAIEELVKILGYVPISFDIDKEYYRVLEMCYKVKLERSFVVTHPEIAKEWNYQKNGKLDPHMFTKGSNVKVWWKCEHGHEWQAVISIRCSQNTGCPVCINHVIVPGDNDLATTHPYFASQWDYERNGDLKPTQVSYGTQRIVWWKCEHGHHWEAPIVRRIYRRLGCPICEKNNLVCSNAIKLADNTIIARHVTEKRYNSLAEESPQLAEEWDYEKNGELKPTDVSYHSRQKVWWKCKKCGYSWQSTVDNRAKGRGCAKCSNRIIETGISDTATLYPQLLKKWDFEKNKGFSLSHIHPGSAKNYWWKCDKCGHEFRAEVRNMVENSDMCAVCSGKIAKPGYNDVATLYPDIIKHWDYAKNTVSPTTIRPGNSKDKYWWKHAVCGHEWDESVADCIKRGGKCPYCNGRRILVGFNDIATKFPHLAKEWNYEKNGDLLPTQISAGSNRTVWWKCSICGHEWRSSIYNRIKFGCSCPKCKKRKDKT